ncbi:MAG: methionyl-tRNA formyltransferase [candidate division WOR-3 bacterium]
MKVAFFSGDEETLPILTGLFTAVELKVLVTHPARPKGRGLKVQPSSLVQFAQEKGINFFSPADPNAPDFLNLLRREEIELGVLVSFRHIIKSELLSLLPKGFVNLHPSLLPKYRGAAPIQRAILAGEEITGVTTILMNERVDAGPIIKQEVVKIGRDETYGELKKRLFQIGAEILRTTLALLEKGEAKPIPQDENLATYAPKIKKEELLITWEKRREAIHNQIRAFSPKPGAFTSFRGKRVIIRKSEIPGESIPSFGKPGTIFQSGSNLFVMTKEGFLRIVELKIEGKGVISGRDFLNGYKPKVGEGFV